MMACQKIECANNLELTIAAQKSLKQILFIPKEYFLLKPIRWIIPRRKYVMEVDQNPGVQDRQYFQHFLQNVALGPNHMRRIHEQDIVGLKLPELLHADVFQSCTQNGYPFAFQLGTFIRLDTYMGT